VSGCVDIWTLADEGSCGYCGTHELVFPEPFGQVDACRTCWEQICYGTGEDD
jgi:ribosomal protein S27E